MSMDRVTERTMIHRTGHSAGPEDGDGTRGGGGPAWPRAGVAVAAVGWGANQFAPLLLVYRAGLGLSAATVEATFGMYALGLIPSLLLCGPLSDRYGRRRVMVPALLASMLASALLMAGGAVGGRAIGLLFAGRLVAGIASGAAFGSGAAWIKELSAADPITGGHPGPRRVTVAMTAGFAGGPLAAGLLAQWAPDPTLVPYLPHLALCGLGLLLALSVPETRTAGAPNTRTSAPWPKAFNSRVLPLAPWVFGSAAIALAYLPGLVETRLGGSALAFTAVVTTLTALAGIVVQPLARRVDRPGTPRLAATAMAIVVAGLLLSAAAATARRPALVLLAALVLGAGYGCCQVCGLLTVQRLAAPERLASLTAVYQAVSYSGFALPFLLSALDHTVSPGVLLLAVAASAGLTLARIGYRER
jgi:MFS family permease